MICKLKIDFKVIESLFEKGFHFTEFTTHLGYINMSDLKSATLLPLKIGRIPYSSNVSSVNTLETFDDRFYLCFPFRSSKSSE